MVSRIDYVNSLLHDIAQKHIASLKRVQNTLARTILGPGAPFLQLCTGYLSNNISTDVTVLMHPGRQTVLFFHVPILVLELSAFLLLGSGTDLRSNTSAVTHFFPQLFSSH